MSVQPKGYFDREPKIRNHGEMMETLKARAAGQSPKEKGSDPGLRRLDSEIWLAKRFMQQCGLDLFDGITDTAKRREAVRTAIKQQYLECVIIGAKDKKPVNWREAFKLVYAEEL